MGIFRYMMRDTWRLLSRHSGLSLLTIVTSVAVFFLVGATILFVLNTRYLVEAVEGDLTIQAYVRDSEEALEAVARKASSYDSVSSVRVVTSGEALERLKARLGKLAEAVALLDENPLPPSVEIQVKRASFATVIARELIAMPEVEEVVYAGAVAERLQSISYFVARLSMVVLVVSLASATLVLFNTIRIGVYARKEEISKMLLVGATRNFVVFPYVLQGVILGTVGAALAVLLLWFSYGMAITALERSLPFLRLLTDRIIVLRVGAVLVLAGVSVGWICSWLAASSFVRQASRSI
ncbi:MAG TPA: permease-like cell division protein FtsX [Synergistales bacterium]|jgi:cell division transport system permease protein|nr:cell division protein FtsX [Synergistaceae bacterium]HPA59078.1 permease-like cell division protein FtsX [Synergistales bacterium]HQO82761.1 permease-like cell division protein FtsX [Synergistales bacterium]HQQ10958.1 permease-like cell division protein FtsX [Synergistales bacterium]